MDSAPKKYPWQRKFQSGGIRSIPYSRAARKAGINTPIIANFENSLEPTGDLKTENISRNAAVVESRPSTEYGAVSAKDTEENATMKSSVIDFTLLPQDEAASAKENEEIFSRLISGYSKMARILLAVDKEELQKALLSVKYKTW